MSTDVKTSAAEALASIARWSQRTFWVTAIGSAVLIAVCLYGLTEYVRFKSAVAAAADQFSSNIKAVGMPRGRR